MPDAEINTEPEIWLTPRVVSAMKAMCDWKPQYEKGLLILGEVDGLTVHATDFAVYPQKGSGGWTELDEDKCAELNFWRKVQAHMDEDTEIIGWGHFFRGGSHHSGQDHETDEVVSMKAHKFHDVPVTVSLTWNDSEIGCEAKTWAEVGDDEIQVSHEDIPVKLDVNDEVIEDYLETVDEDDVEIKFRFLEEAFGIQVGPRDLGWAKGWFVDAYKDYILNNLDDFKEHEEAWATVGDAMVDDGLAQAVEDQFDKFFKKKRRTKRKSSNDDDDDSAMPAGWYRGRYGRGRGQSYYRKSGAPSHDASSREDDVEQSKIPSSVDLDELTEDEREAYMDIMGMAGVEVDEVADETDFGPGGANRDDEFDIEEISED